MEIFPAIDIKNAQVVRLTQGDYNRVTVYATDGAAIANDFKNQGATNLHVVDLDGAKDGALSNFDTIAAIAKEGGLFIEVGGGIRDEERIKRYLDMGIGRVILGTAALQNPDFLSAMVQKYGRQIAVGVDAKDGFVAVNGWLETSATDSVSFCKTVRDMGAKTVIYTDISKDGAMSGTNLEIYKTLSQIEGLDIMASGGISSESDIIALKNMNLYGAIVGKAIYSGALNLRHVLSLV